MINVEMKKNKSFYKGSIRRLLKFTDIVSACRKITKHGPRCFQQVRIAEFKWYTK